jgi:polygalacturonase
MVITGNVFAAGAEAQHPGASVGQTSLSAGDSGIPAAPTNTADPLYASQAADRAWAGVPGILARIVPPAFPAREFVLTNYGAAGDGVKDCTQAFKDAIADCARSGGGKVVVPPGTFLTGAIHLRSNINLCVSKGATIKFSTDPKQFLPVVFSRDVAEMMNYSPFIYAFEQQNIAITGEGTLDGQASSAVWHQWKKLAEKDAQLLAEMAFKGIPATNRIMGEGHHIRPNFVEPVRCCNVLIEGVHITDSPMWVLHPLYCTNVTIRGVSVQSHGPNTDGCDPESCTDVLIKDCSFEEGDDCIAVKSGRDAEGRRIAIPCQNVVIQNCLFKDGHGGVTIGSETSGGIRNVFAENCRFDSPNLDQAMRFKTNPARGGFIENIFLRNCTVKTARFGIYITMKYGSSGASSGDFIPVVRNIDIRDSSFSNLTKQPIYIEGLSESAPVTDVTIANCTFQQAAAGSTITNASRVRLLGCRGLDR